MVDLVFEGFEGTLNVSKVNDPAKTLIERPFDVNLNLETVAVQPAALVSRRYMGEAMRCFNREYFEYLHPRPPLPDSRELVCLKAQAPDRITEAVSNRLVSI